MTNKGEPMDAVREYALHLRRRGLAALTIQHRVGGLRIAERHAGPLLELDGRRIEEFLDGLRGRTGGPLLASSRTVWVVRLGSFYKWAVEYELIDRNPMTRVARPKGRAWQPKPIAEDHYWRAVDEAPSPLIRKWVLLGGHAGLRCCEIAGLTADQIDVEARSMRVLGKGAKWRIIPMHRLLVDELRHAPRSGRLWSHPSGAPFTPKQVSAFGAEYLSSVGPAAGMHMLRHRFACAVYIATGDIAVVAELLGHAQYDTARAYVEITDRRKRGVIDGLE
jgi:integrase/recombinase XerD